MTPAAMIAALESAIYGVPPCEVGFDCSLNARPSRYREPSERELQRMQHAESDWTGVPREM